MAIYVRPPSARATPVAMTCTPFARTRPHQPTRPITYHAPHITRHVPRYQIIEHMFDFRVFRKITGQRPRPASPTPNTP